MSNKNIRLVYGGGLLISAAYGCSFFLPLYIQTRGGNEADAGWLFAIIGLGTIISVTFSGPLFKRIAAKNLAALGALIYGFGLIGLLSTRLYSACFLLGCGWGFYYNAAPYILSNYANEKTRSIYFNYLSAITVLGSCVAPVLIRYIFHKDVDFAFLFFIGCLICFLAALIFYFIQNDEIKVTAHLNPRFKNNNQYESLTIYPLIMVFLGACIVTIILNFQTTFANEAGLNYASFYTLYAVSTVVARFMLGKILASFNQTHLIMCLIFLMIIALFSFEIAIYYSKIYLFSTVLFAVSYGLLYPTLQAITVNLASGEMHAKIITYFSLFYFLGLYVFPTFGGFLIVTFGYSNTIFSLIMLAIIDLVFSVLLYKKINSKKMAEYRI